MTYMDTKTFDLWADSNIDGFHEGQVEIDEVIAPIIRELNLKGYKTAFCCSGHPFYSLCEAFVETKDTAKGIVGLIETEPSNRTDYPVRALYVIPDDYFYISFTDNVRDDISKALPDGFIWDNERTIQYIYTQSEFYAFLAERMKASKSLYEWATQLPAV